MRSGSGAVFRRHLLEAVQGAGQGSRLLLHLPFLALQLGCLPMQRLSLHALTAGDLPEPCFFLHSVSQECGMCMQAACRWHAEEQLPLPDPACQRHTHLWHAGCMQTQVCAHARARARVRAGVRVRARACVSVRVRACVRACCALSWPSCSMHNIQGEVPCCAPVAEARAAAAWLPCACRQLPAGRWPSPAACALCCPPAAAAPCTPPPPGGAPGSANAALCQHLAQGCH